ncbi:Tryptophan-rich Synechocystis species C-terminal domain family [Synechococcus sp. PCC 7335]|uniref:M10 family metallopeptidase C-terminal domain-containing protein n=1 Tax=Synechococcus sp. (strain ATCC 29403 / PCC 7335) TaxID=91464 RepID=UPI00017EE764|nr:M10 family metallopeptidase C-terminal domain-containing protein [Synechococcus sp. PCC 7335]EDX84867.1 Tryptophan-rich Synechocystis species C-terminal domain family [Synechococcus sp. PCC 7335]
MAIIDGTRFADILQGTNEDDIINGLEGNDSIEAAGGNDQLRGGAGDDTLTGGAGADDFVIEQTSGNSNNTVTDFVKGEDGIDLRTLGISEFETILPLLSNNAEGNAVITTLLTGWVSTTEIEGLSVEQLSANDFIFDSSTTGDEKVGTRFDDDLFGGLGNDTLTGDTGEDRLFGENGNDRLIGGSGDDTLTGGAGADDFVIEQTSGNSNNTVTDFVKGEDGIDLRTLGISEFETILPLLSSNAEGNAVITTLLTGWVSTTEIEGLSVEQLSANDFIFDSSIAGNEKVGTRFDDDLFGGLGNDTLTGDSGEDRLFGENGNDRLIGGSGDDTLTGGAGAEDVAVFSGAFIEYELSQNSGRIIVENISGNGDGTDVLSGIERIQFSDRTINTLPTVIEAAGDSSLLRTFLDGAYRVQTAGRNPVNVTFQGRRTGPFNGWQAIGAEALTGGGYQLAWRRNGSQYSIWNLDGRGRFVSARAYNSQSITQLESAFGQNFNGDGSLAPAATAIEAAGNLSLVVTNRGAYQLQAADLNPLDVILQGGQIGAFNGWQAIGAEAQTGGGYQVAWRRDNGRFGIWNLDGRGRFISARGYDSQGITRFESAFGQDFDGDDLLAPAARVIEDNGNLSLVIASNGAYQLQAADLNPLDVILQGNQIGAFNGWQAIGAEARTGGGYQVAWRRNDGRFGVWNLDGQGRFISATGYGSQGIAQFESAFSQDLNGDGF